MSWSELIALAALILGVITSVAAFIYWLINISYKSSKLLFEMKTDIKEIIVDLRSYSVSLHSVKKQVAFLTKLMRNEHPQYFKREEDWKDAPDD